MTTFRLLGEVGIQAAGRSVDAGHARIRTVLAALLVDVNRVVPADTLADRVWGEQLPRRPREALYSYLSRLRRVLEEVPQARLAKRSGGYVLEVDEACVDLHRFRALVREAGALTDDHRRAELLGTALELWTEQPLTGVDSEWAGQVREALVAERLAARLAECDLRLRLDQHGQLIVGLTALAAHHPLDEQVWCRLLIALARNGRQAEALVHYDALRRRLGDELGVDPGPELRGIHQRILSATADPAPAPAPVVPRQLPAAPTTFAGRARELATLDATCTPGGVASISAIGGVGGVGKTWLALTWAHRNAGRFPDGQLYVNLRGHDPTSEPLGPEVALRGLLGGLGVDHAAMPPDLDALAALYRGILVDRTVLVFLDDARDAAQVLPLLPGGGRSAVLITSRNSLPDLAVTRNARPIPLGTLPDTESRELLARRLGGDRLSAEPAAVDEILRWCAGLPLALTITASRAGEGGLGALAAELRRTSDRLGALDTGGSLSNLRTVFEASHAVLSPAAARLFRQLGVAPGPDISVPAVAAIAGPAARALLRELVLASLVHEHRPGRYRMHDLVRLYATEKCAESERSQALDHVVDHYLHSAIACATVMCAHLPVEDLAPALPGTDPYQPADLADATRWIDTEHPALMAVCELRRPVVTWQLARALNVHHWRRGRLRDCITTWTAARQVADEVGEIDVVARADTNIGDSHANLGDFPAALRHLERGLAIARDRVVRANAHNSLAWAHDGNGDHQAALRHARLALDLYRELGRPQLQADMLNCEGWSLIRLGRAEEGRAACEKALALCDELGHIDGTAHVSRSLGTLALELGDHEEAARRFRLAVELFQRLEHPFAEAGVLSRLGEAELALGNDELARSAWERALTLYKGQHRTAAGARVQEWLSRVRR